MHTFIKRAKNLLTVTAMTFALATSNAALAGPAVEYFTSDDVLTKDKKVKRIKRSLNRNQFDQLNLVTNTVFYAFPPTAASYKMAETVITLGAELPDQGDGPAVEYVFIHVDIMYNNDLGTYSAGDIVVEYKAVN